MKLDNEDLRNALERVDGESWLELAQAVPEDIARKLQLSVTMADNIVISHYLVADAPLGNRAIGLGITAPCSRDSIFRLVDRFKATGMKNFALQISPYARPADMEQWLHEADLVIRSRYVKLVRGAQGVDRVDSDVRLVAPEQKELFGDVSARGFERPPIIAHFMASTVGMPRWRHYLAYVDGQPAGAAAMYIDNKYAWLGIGSTLPDQRSKGVQQSLIARRIADGLKEGVEYFVSETESFNASCKNLMRFGFECAYERPNYGIKI